MQKFIKSFVVVFLVMGSCACKNTDAKKRDDRGRPSVSFPKPEYRKAALTNVELGLGYLSQGQVVRAKSKLTQAIKLAPEIPETHSAMSYFLEMTGEYREAEKQHRKALRLSDSKGAVYNNYGAFLCRRGRFKEADRAFNEALEDKEYSRTAEVYENAGLCAVRAATVDKARHYLSTAVRRDPHRASAMLELADLDVREAKFTDARQLLDRYRHISEPTARSLWLGIQTSRALGDSNRMASEALLLKSLFESSPEYQWYLDSQKKSKG